MSIEITAFYASLLALLFIVLTFRVIHLRLTNKVGLGDGEVSALSKAVRIHGNFAEFIPLALLLMLLLELNGGSAMWLHVTGAVLFIGRVMHAIGITKSKGTTIYRQVGLLSTCLVLLGLSIHHIIGFVF